ncbi:hypothetical protein LJB77_00410 [Ruminococcaceae bacterium OttesenSCG-928-N02]|nr:hypothetical protein [Ruminococcaceae bacterium OttesenSCG-928-N02]
MALDFLILYEHPVREYESILLLKLELERRGYTVEIQQLLAQKKRSRFKGAGQPRVLVASNLYDDEGLNSHVFNNAGRCARAVNLHWEQMLSDTQEQQPWFNFSGNAKLCTQTCWGEKTRARLVAHGMQAQNCPVTGAIMLDFLRPEFSGYFKGKQALCKEFGLDENKQLFLYISSFGYASMQADEVAELSAMAGTDFTQFAATNKRSMSKTLEWFGQYLQAHPEVEFVYRRHPSEWASKELADLQAVCPNFHVIFSGSVKEWIVAADNIFIWMSTAIAEVYFAGKSCHILRPYPIEHEFDPVIYKNATYVCSYEAFEVAAGQTGGAFPIAPHVLQGYFSSTATPAYLRMADLLEQVHKETPAQDIFAPPFRPHFNTLKYVALAGVNFLHRRGWKPEKLFFFLPPLARFAQRIYGYIEKAAVTPEAHAAAEARLRPYVQRIAQTHFPITPETNKNSEI